jgi:hypothetical protein
MDERKAIPERSIPAVLLERILQNGYEPNSEFFEVLVSRDSEEPPIVKGYRITYQEMPWNNEKKPLIFGKAVCISPRDSSREKIYVVQFTFTSGKDRQTIMSRAYECGQRIPCLQRVVKPASNGKRKSDSN